MFSIIMKQLTVPAIFVRPVWSQQVPEEDTTIRIAKYRMEIRTGDSNPRQTGGTKRGY
jgi:hypothetical protein